MESTTRDDDEIYISVSKKNIHFYIDNNNYRLAFGLLLAVLDRLDDGKQKNDFIKYYLDDFFKLNSNDSQLNPR